VSAHGHGTTADLANQVRALARPLEQHDDLDALLRRIGDARYVLLGEASHGTAEYYAWRTAISQRLIREKGFSFIAVEGDWPDCARVNRFVKGRSDADGSARDALDAFARWPTWMWANEEVLELAQWLRAHNDRQPEARKVGFYGLDVYSLWQSLRAVLTWLRRYRPEALPAARRAVECFEPYGIDGHDYARAAGWVDTSCEADVRALLTEMRRAAGAGRNGGGPEAVFDAEQNAVVIANAERYYRTMIGGGPDSWNVRDRHMAETLDRLMRHHERQRPGAKAIVWAHNTHVGDARFTDMAAAGMVNIGQLARDAHAADGVVLVGFGSYEGTVLAGREWEAPMERMSLPAARPDSWEDVFHRAAGRDALLLCPRDATPEMRHWRGHRAVGVVYRPESETGNYVPSVLPRRYDAFLYLDVTAALHPLPGVRARDEREVPETFPSGV
jgi:erythromycin esterase